MEEYTIISLKDNPDRKDEFAGWFHEKWGIPLAARGIAGKMLNFVCEDMKRKGVDTLYFLTDHTSFYERYGWEFLCMVQRDGEDEMSRMYIKGGK